MQLVDTLLDPRFGIRAKTFEDNPHADDDLAQTRAWLRIVPRFVLNDKATTFVMKELCPTLKPAHVAQAKLPYGAFWVETGWQDMGDGRRNRFGVLFGGYDEAGRRIEDAEIALTDGSLTSGGIIVSVEDGFNTMMLSFNLDFARVLTDEAQIGPMLRMQNETYYQLREWMGGGAASDLMGKGDAVDERVLELLAKIGFFLAGVGIVLASPHAHEREAVDMTKLDAKRKKAGKSGRVDYTRIKISPIPPLSGRSEGPNADGTAATGGHRRYHPVKFFTRVRNGKLESVRPHWRGNPDFGTKQGNYRLT